MGMIRSFRDRDTHALFGGEAVRRFAGIVTTARQSLDMLDAAHGLSVIHHLMSVP